ncbi:MAG: response regulator transcription factor [Oligoflexia bacterium]|nr:response regulator transcription factor [Oligoflexia bacterium]
MTALPVTQPRILVAEDDEHISRLIAFKLGREGFEAVVAKDGAEALRLLGEGPWSLAILDAMMPFHDGWEVLRTLRGMPALAGLPVIMLTARSDPQARAGAEALGARFMKKPFDPSELVVAVREAMESAP